MAVVTVTKENFEEILNSETAVVEFWAPWCGYCKRLAPVIKALAKEQEALLIALVNIDELEELAHRFEVETIPTLLVFHHGTVGERLIAPDTKANIVEWLKAEKAIG